MASSVGVTPKAATSAAPSSTSSERGVRGMRGVGLRSTRRHPLRSSMCRGSSMPPSPKRLVRPDTHTHTHSHTQLTLTLTLTRTLSNLAFNRTQVGGAPKRTRTCSPRLCRSCVDGRRAASLPRSSTAIGAALHLRMQQALYRHKSVNPWSVASRHPCRQPGALSATHMHGWGGRTEARQAPSSYAKTAGRRCSM